MRHHVENQTLHHLGLLHRNRPHLPRLQPAGGAVPVRSLDLDAAALAALGKQLKAACGSGGTAKDGVIEVQGDHVATVMAALGKLGYAVKRSGG